MGDLATQVELSLLRRFPWSSQVFSSLRQAGYESTCPPVLSEPTYPGGLSPQCSFNIGCHSFTCLAACSAAAPSSKVPLSALAMTVNRLINSKVDASYRKGCHAGLLEDPPLF